MSDRRHPSRNIILSGFDQCGKTTVGREVARRLRRPFVDIPTELERRKASLAQQLRMFRSDPNPGEIEAKLINDLSYRREAVIALAADTLEHAEYAEDLAIFSFVVFLDPPFDLLWSRLHDKPQAANTLCALGRDTVHALWHERRRAYEHCELQLTHPWHTPAHNAQLIMHCFYT